MVNILISPAKGCRGFVVLLDVAEELSRQVSFGSEDSSINDRALNFRKPDFNLVEPTRIGRRVMEPNCRIGVKELKKHPWFCARSSCRPRYEFLCQQAGWPRSCSKSQQIPHWYVGRWSYR